MLQRAARGYGSKFIGSEDFIRTLAQRQAGRTQQGGKPPPEEETKPGAAAAAEQTSYWLKVFGDMPAVEPDDGGVGAAPAQSATTKQQSTEPPATRGLKTKSQSRRAQEDSKRKGSIDSDELAYWMNVFGGQSAADPAPASADELRLSDLENWLKNFEAAEGDAAKKRR
jgi:hypothetical protein